MHEVALQFADPISTRRVGLPLFGREEIRDRIGKKAQEVYLEAKAKAHLGFEEREGAGRQASNAMLDIVMFHAGTH